MIAEPPAPMPAHFAHAIRAAVAEWQTTYGGADACDATRVRVVEADDTQIEELCGWSANQIHACYAGRGVLVIKASHPRHEKVHSIAHEALHWLAECSGAFPDADPKHDAADIWALDSSGLLGRLFGDRMLGLHPAELDAVGQLPDTCSPFGPRVIETADADRVRAMCGQDASTIRGCHTADAIVIVRRDRPAQYDRRTRLYETLHWIEMCSGGAVEHEHGLRLAESDALDRALSATAELHP